ncbi:MAG: hypothetical protein K2P41_10355, partial [Lachnospiraceae bacterium]|nr:hypothetical protein [Lachnospiraceae bacterium]
RWKAGKRFAPSSSATSYILSLINFVTCLVMKTDRPLFDSLSGPAGKPVRFGFEIFLRNFSKSC